MFAVPDKVSIRKVIDFWFSDSAEHRWFDPDPAFDREIVEKFTDLHQYAHQGELSGWMQSAEGALALVIVFDQFPRNMFRGTPKAFASDEQAREVSRAAIANAFDRQRSVKERQFFYLPLMHSEDLADQTECVQFYRRVGVLQEALASAIQHRDIIACFGRFPHRNAILGRDSSEEEQEFLKTHDGF